MATAVIDGIEVYYETKGSGSPLLMFAPGGFDATIDKWVSASAWKDINALDALAAEHTVVVYDRREAGRSGGRVERLGWGSYTRQAKDSLGSFANRFRLCHGRLYGVFGSAGIWRSLPGKSSRSTAPLAGGRISLEGKRLGAVPASLRFHQDKRSQSGCRARTDRKKFLVRSGVGPLGVGDRTRSTIR